MMINWVKSEFLFRNCVTLPQEKKMQLSEICQVIDKSLLLLDPSLYAKWVRDDLARVDTMFQHKTRATNSVLGWKKHIS